ncbi:16S rRNA (cytidine(1402)-2'-O)-methyltransferase [Maritimibacter sp. 55A14]|uniref:16S rRNA (cytidine(1402)-2'-O)-methyltransferase n=1 Tax=Maritimibacter sp. 55A14 TaxID=2174844 RepID=UPI001E54748C|nr:16S rRNA (cytidine(1402)-2'-O)-methyltransferase [Maritimibacter sp. 55A14]
MPQSPAGLAPGLNFVATPIGAARDITLRALDILAAADVIAAEDTRTARKLMDIHGIAPGDRPLIAYHDHNGAAQRPRLLAFLREGRSVACVSEAGTPLISDPGYVLAREAIAEGIEVRAAPGASALLAALTVSGLPSDRFFFAGFAPPAQGARLSYLKNLADVPGTLIFYESPKRVGKLLTDMVEALGGARQAAVCRELTKKFEETRRGSLADLAAHYAQDAPRGEVVVLVDRPGERQASADEVEEALKMHLAEGSVKDAVAAVTETYGLPRREVYKLALKLEKGV